MKSLKEMQDAFYGKGEGPPMLCHETDPKAVRLALKRRKASKKTEPKEEGSQIVKLTKPPPAPPTPFPASSLPEGFPRELSYRALAAYSLIRTLSVHLRLSPFTPNVFLRALYLPFPNRLLGHIHVAILRFLLSNLHIGYHWGNGSTKSTPLCVTKKRRIDSVRWPLQGGDNLDMLDIFTWPVFYDDYCHLTADVHYASINDTTSHVEWKNIDVSRIKGDLDEEREEEGRMARLERRSQAVTGQTAKPSSLYLEPSEDETEVDDGAIEEDSDEEFRVEDSRRKEVSDEDDSDEDFIQSSKSKKAKKRGRKSNTNSNNSATKRSSNSTTPVSSSKIPNSSQSKYSTLNSQGGAHSAYTYPPQQYAINPNGSPYPQAGWVSAANMAQYQHQYATDPYFRQMVQQQWAAQQNMPDKRTWYAPATPGHQSHHVSMSQSKTTSAEHSKAHGKSYQKMSSPHGSVPFKHKASERKQIDDKPKVSAVLEVETPTGSAMSANKPGNFSRSTTIDRLQNKLSPSEAGKERKLFNRDSSGGSAVWEIEAPKSIVKSKLIASSSKTGSDFQSDAPGVEETLLTLDDFDSPVKTKAAGKRDRPESGDKQRSLKLQKTGSGVKGMGQDSISASRVIIDVDKVTSKPAEKINILSLAEKLNKAKGMKPKQIDEPILLDYEEPILLGNDLEGETVEKIEEPLLLEDDLEPKKSKEIYEPLLSEMNMETDKPPEVEDPLLMMGDLPSELTKMVNKSRAIEKNLKYSGKMIGKGNDFESKSLSTISSALSKKPIVVAKKDRKFLRNPKAGNVASPISTKEKTTQYPKIKNLNTLGGNDRSSSSARQSEVKVYGAIANGEKAIPGVRPPKHEAKGAENSSGKVSSGSKTETVARLDGKGKLAVSSKSVDLPLSKSVPSKTSSSQIEHRPDSFTKRVFGEQQILPSDRATKSQGQDSSKPGDPFGNFLEKFIRGEKQESGGKGIKPSNFVKNESDTPEEDNYLDDRHWCHFQPLKEMRSGIPHHLLSVERKLDVLEFLLDELLCCVTISAEFSRRGLVEYQSNRLYGSLPSKRELADLYNADECGVCLAEGELLCCDGCVASYHRECIGMAKGQSLPEGQWLCPECKLEDPAKFGSLNGGRKGALDWFTAEDIENASGKNVSVELLQSASIAEQKSGAGVAQKNLEQYLVVHGFLFNKKQGLSSADDLTPEALSVGLDSPVPVKCDQMENMLTSNGWMKLQPRPWPIFQIPTDQSYFNTLDRFDPSCYTSKYRNAPFLPPVPRPKNPQIPDYENRCCVDTTLKISEFLSNNFGCDCNVEKALRERSPIYDPCHMIKGFFRKLEADLYKACLLHDSWPSQDNSDWSRDVKKCTSIRKFASLLLKLVDKTHPRAFVGGWLSPVESKLQSNSFVNEEELLKDTSTQIQLTSDLDPVISAEAKRWEWERSSAENISLLLSCDFSRLQDWIGELRPDLLTDCPRKKRKQSKARASVEIRVVKEKTLSDISLLDETQGNTDHLVTRRHGNVRSENTDVEVKQDGWRDSGSKAIQLIEDEKKKKMDALVNELAVPILKEGHWVVAGRLLFDPVGYLPRSTVRRLGRKAGCVVAPFTTYSETYEVGQAAAFHVWRKRVMACASHQDLIFCIRVLESFLDTQFIRKCAVVAQKLLKNKGKPSMTIRHSQTDLRTGVIHHLIVDGQKHVGRWVSSLYIDIQCLVSEALRRRKANIEKLQKKATEERARQYREHMLSVTAKAQKLKKAVSQKAAQKTEESAKVSAASEKAVIKQKPKTMEVPAKPLRDPKSVVDDTLEILKTHASEVKRLVQLFGPSPVPEISLKLAREKSMRLIQNLTGTFFSEAQIMSELMNVEKLGQKAPANVPQTESAVTKEKTNVISNIPDDAEQSKPAGEVPTEPNALGVPQTQTAEFNSHEKPVVSQPRKPRKKASSAEPSESDPNAVKVLKRRGRKPKNAARQVIAHEHNSDEANPLADGMPGESASKMKQSMPETDAARNIDQHKSLSGSAPVEHAVNANEGTIPDNLANSTIDKSTAKVNQDTMDADMSNSCDFQNVRADSFGGIALQDSMTKAKQSNIQASTAYAADTPYAVDHAYAADTPYAVDHAYAADTPYAVDHAYAADTPYAGDQQSTQTDPLTDRALAEAIAKANQGILQAQGGNKTHQDNAQEMFWRKFNQQDGSFNANNMLTEQGQSTGYVENADQRFGQSGAFTNTNELGDQAMGEENAHLDVNDGTFDKSGQATLQAGFVMNADQHGNNDSFGRRDQQGVDANFQSTMTDHRPASDSLDATMDMDGRGMLENAEDTEDFTSKAKKGKRGPKAASKPKPEKRGTKAKQKTENRPPKIAKKAKSEKRGVRASSKAIYDSGDIDDEDDPYIQQDSALGGSGNLIDRSGTLHQADESGFSQGQPQNAMVNQMNDDDYVDSIHEHGPGTMPTESVPAKDPDESQMVNYAQLLPEHGGLPKNDNQSSLAEQASRGSFAGNEYSFMNASAPAAGTAANPRLNDYDLQMDAYPGLSIGQNNSYVIRDQSQDQAASQRTLGMSNAAYAEEDSTHNDVSNDNFGEHVNATQIGDIYAHAQSNASQNQALDHHRASSRNEESHGDPYAGLGGAGLTNDTHNQGSSCNGDNRRDPYSRVGGGTTLSSEHDRASSRNEDNRRDPYSGISDNVGISSEHNQASSRNADNIRDQYSELGGARLAADNHDRTSSRNEDNRRDPYSVLGGTNQNDDSRSDPYSGLVGAGLATENNSRISRNEDNRADLYAGLAGAGLNLDAASANALSSAQLNDYIRLVAGQSGLSNSQDQDFISNQNRNDLYPGLSGFTVANAGSTAATNPGDRNEYDSHQNDFSRYGLSQTNTFQGQSQYQSQESLSGQSRNKGTGLTATSTGAGQAVPALTAAAGSLSSEYAQLLAGQGGFALSQASGQGQSGSQSARQNESSWSTYGAPQAQNYNARSLTGITTGGTNYSQGASTNQDNSYYNLGLSSVLGNAPAASSLYNQPSSSFVSSGSAANDLLQLVQQASQSSQFGMQQNQVSINPDRLQLLQQTTQGSFPSRSSINNSYQGSSTQQASTDYIDLLQNLSGLQQAPAPGQSFVGLSTDNLFGGTSSLAQQGGYQQPQQFSLQQFMAPGSSGMGNNSANAHSNQGSSYNGQYYQFMR